MNDSERRLPAFLDPGWLFLLAGLATLGATILIPAQMDVDKARWLRDRALAVEAQRQARLFRYEEYLAALENKEPSLVLSLAASQLNQIPADRQAIPGTNIDALRNASIFPALEPPPAKIPEYRPIDSALVHWTTDNHKRLYLILGASVCVLIGLLPPSRGWASFSRKHPYLEPTRI